MRYFAITFCWLGLLLGCGPGGDELQLVPASGVVTFKNRPLVGYDVYCKPEAEDGRTASGRTDADGRFVLGTEGEANGAQVGRFKVYILRPSEDMNVEPGREELGMVQEQKSVLPAKFESPNSSGLFIEVPAEGTDSLKITI
ncbi:MAG: hypothetical protein KDB03_14155 [Planctomycetales bacterium]|nr:hypothetical protein [Planctomycetales bacterium]